MNVTSTAAHSQAPNAAKITWHDSFFVPIGSVMTKVWNDHAGEWHGSKSPLHSNKFDPVATYGSLDQALAGAKSLSAGNDPAVVVWKADAKGEYVVSELVTKWNAKTHPLSQHLETNDQVAISNPGVAYVVDGSIVIPPQVVHDHVAGAS